METSYQKQILIHNDSTTNKNPLDQQQTPSLNYSRNNGQQHSYKEQSRNKKIFKKTPFIQPEQQETLITELCDLDKSLALLIAKRTRLLNKIQLSNSTTTYEKILRKSWEETVQSFSKDSKFTRQLFNLLQEVKVSHKDLQNVLAFSLKPKQQPVNINLNLPSCFYTTQLYLALAACSGIEGYLHNVLINDPIINSIKALNQLDACLRWEKNGDVIYKKTEVLKTRYQQPIDKVIHVGDNLLLFYLLTFLSVIRPARIKFIGDSTLKLTDFSSLRNFLPQFGARIINTIHGQDGLPMRIEASAILPDTINIPKELPVDAVIALFMATPGWDKKVTIHIKNHPYAKKITQTVIPILTACHIPVETNTQNDLPISIQITPAPAVITNPCIDTYSPAAITLLSLPAFVGGTVCLKKNLNQTCNNLLPAIDFLNQAGLSVNETETHITSIKTQNSLVHIKSFSNVQSEFLPIAITLALIPIATHGNQLPDLPKELDITIVESYFDQLGLTYINNKITVKDSPKQSPWVSPSVEWSFAFSLAAFLYPGIKLSNPGSIETYFPQFWRIYNTLPTPTLSQEAPMEKPSSPINTQENRRRIITQHVSLLKENFTNNTPNKQIYNTDII